MTHARTTSILSLAVATALAAGPASFAAPPRPASEGRTIGGAIAQPIRDLNLLREKLPTPLVEAGKSPYAAPADCAAVETELAALTQALGPDVDDPGSADESGFSGEALVAGAVRSAIGLPFRGVVRRLTGAEKRDQTFRTAVLAGMVRRGYLKGVRSQMACDGAPVLTQAAAPAPAPPSADVYGTDVSDRVSEVSGPPEQVHDRGEVADVDGLVQQRGADKTVVRQGAVAGGEDERHLLFREGGS